MWKWVLGFILGFIILLAGGGYYASTLPSVQDFLKQLKGQEKATMVRLEPADKGSLTRTVSAPGVVDSKTVVKIAAQVSARITALPFKENESVKEGDVVVRLDAVELTTQLDQSKANLRAEEARLEGTQAALSRAKADLDRVEKLHKSGDRSDAEFEAVKSQYLQQEAGLRAAEQGIESARAQVRRAERDLSNSVITSPINGTVTKVNNEVGELVLGTFNNAGTVILELADLNTMIMKAEVDESNVEAVKRGQKTKVYINAFPDREFEGTVDNVRPQKQVGQRDGKNYFETEILLELPDTARQYTGLTANCDIAVETLYDVLRVPSQAVLDRRVEELPKDVQTRIHGAEVGAKGKAFARVVYKVADGKAIAVPVTSGTSDLKSTVILTGLEPGDKIITGPYKVLAALKDGQKVQEEAIVKPAGGGGEAAKPGEKAAASADKPADPPAPVEGTAEQKPEQKKAEQPAGQSAPSSGGSNTAAATNAPAPSSSSPPTPPTKN